MTVELGEEDQKFLEEAVQAGLFPNPSAAVSWAIAEARSRMTSEKMETEQLRRELQKGADDFAQGRFKVFDAEDVIARGRARLAASRAEK